MRGCAKRCLNKNKRCDEKECRLWINYPEDRNCTLIAVYKNGAMTLEEVAKRLGYTPARIQQLEKRALQKISLRAAYLKDFLFNR
jgi:DNA-directed RNA polymerase specialized sigma subunit